MSPGVPGEKSPGLAALLNFLFYGAGYIYVGGRWLLPGIALVVLGIGASLWSSTLLPAPTNATQARAMLDTLAWLCCSSVIIAIVFAVHGYRVAEGHNDRIYAAPPPPDPGPCHVCRAAMTYVPHYRRWFCAICRRYD